MADSTGELDLDEPEADDPADDEAENTLWPPGFGPEAVPGGRRVRLVGGDTIGCSGPMTPDEAAVVRELLDAEEANRLRGATLENQSRLARARRRVEEALAAG